MDVLAHHCAAGLEPELALQRRDGQLRQPVRRPRGGAQRRHRPRVTARGHTDVRPALLAVAQYIRREGTRITELAARTQLTKATVVCTVDELEGTG